MNSCTDAELNALIDTTMRVGELQGRKVGERDTYRRLAELLDDPAELAAEIGGRVLAEDAGLFLMVESAAERDPEGFRRLCDAVEEGPEAEKRLAREWGVTPEDDEGESR